MTNALLCRRWLLAGAWAFVCPLSLFATQTTVTVGNVEQGSAGSIWDSGSLTVTINGHSESITFGQFSTAQSVASGIAAKFSFDCNSPVKARVQGAVITFTTKNPDDSFFEVSSSPVWNTTFAQSSFDLLHPAAQSGSLSASLNLSCSPDPIPAGGSVDCTAQLPAGATGTVHFSLGSQSSSSAVDGSGYAPASTIMGLQAGSYTLNASYSGDNQYNPTTQSLPITVLGGALSTASVYSYSITKSDGVTSGYLANGNIAAYTDKVNGTWGSAQLGNNMQYDSLNRLVGGNWQPANGSAAQYLCWQYDSFGNRQAD
jgi:hypothetical protein